MIVADEAAELHDGKKVITTFQRVGRSKNNVFSLITQSVNDNDG